MFRKKASMVLAVSILTISTTALVAQTPSLPLATSYKASANITSLGHGTNKCSDDRFPVSVSGNGVDFDGPYVLKEELCADPLTAVFSGRFEIRHTNEGFVGTYSGPFNGTFFPSGQVLEVHATWRVTKGDGVFAGMIGAGTAKGVAIVANGGPGPARLFSTAARRLKTTRTINDLTADKGETAEPSDGSSANGFADQGPKTRSSQTEQEGDRS